MARKFVRKLQGYEGTETTSQEIADLLPRFLGQLGAAHHERPDLILAAWPQVIGAKLSPMAKAVSFVDGILLVKVSNSTLYSLLSQHERGRLLKSLREKFPTALIKNISFRLG
jgi:hypothetical protein